VYVRRRNKHLAKDMSAGQYRGTTVEQDPRFANKEKRMLKAMSKEFPPEFSQKADLSRVKWASIRPWITRRVTELLGGVEDEILLNFIFESVEGKKTLDPRMLQISLMGFLEKNTGTFCKELWALLLDASSSRSGVPEALETRPKARREIPQDRDYHRYRDDESYHRRHGEHRQYDDDNARRGRRSSRWDYDYDEYSPRRRGERDRRRYSRSRSRSADSFERRNRFRIRSPSVEGKLQSRIQSRTNVKKEEEDPSST